MRAIDLFAGCGALSLGLRQAGFDVKVAVEIDPRRARTYQVNHPTTTVLARDVTNVSSKELLELLGLKRGQLDLVAGCPPCQGFSRIRRRNALTAVKDKRNKLVEDFGRIVLGLKPRAVMMENVPGLERDRRFRRLLRSLRGAGYRVGWEILSLERYGVPQRRRRLVMIGWRGVIPPDLAALPVTSTRTVRDAIGQLPTIPEQLRGLQKYRVKRSTVVRDRIQNIPRNGGSRRDLRDSLRLGCHLKVTGFKDVYGRMKWTKVSPTITGGCINPSKGRFLHPEKNRAITLIEAARLQTFPIWYQFDITDGRYPIAEMIGEALPPRFARIAAKFIASEISLKR